MPPPVPVNMTVTGSVPDAFGKVYTPKQLAELWQLSPDSIRGLFQDRPGVFTLGNDNPRSKRGYTTLRIPAAVAEAVWQERCKRARSVALRRSKDVRTTPDGY